MSEQRGSIVDDILYMQRKMGEDADLGNAENLDEYEDDLYELYDEELYDTYSMVNSQYEWWLTKRRKLDANPT